MDGDSSAPIIENNTIKPAYTWNGRGPQGTVFLEDAIDLTKYSTIEIICSKNTGSGYGSSLAVTPEVKAGYLAGDSNNSYIVNIDSINEKIALDVTNLTGNYYLAITMQGYTITVDKIEVY